MKWFHEKRVVVPFDYSGESVEAVKVGLQLVGQSDDLYVVHVLVELPATDPVVIWDEFNDEKRKTTARESIEESLAKADIEGVQINVAVGNPGKVIAEIAEEVDAGLIVIPSHGFTGLKHFFLGSVAERVVHLAKCPVLVLKGQSETESP